MTHEGRRARAPWHNAWDVETFGRGFPGTRVLGLRDSANPCWRASRGARCRDHAPRPVRPDEGAAARLWALDLRATDLFSLALKTKATAGGRDYTEPLICL